MGTYFRFMAQTGYLGSFDLNEKAIILDFLHATFNLLAFLEV
jgi:hypothetical protein